MDGAGDKAADPLEKDKVADPVEKDKVADPVEKDKDADPLQKDIDPLRLSTSRGHTPGPRRGAGRGRTPGHRGPTAASQPMPPLTFEVAGGVSERPRRSCTQEETTTKKKK